ncbi:MAG: hypothetical protein HQ538_05185 [Parcubacteria group bacterium]|nr:hypothetical protein [Parcubacteria group bacterium]
MKKKIKKQANIIFVKLIILLAVFVSGVLFSSSITKEVQATNYWHIETVVSEGDIGHKSSLALDSFGRPHISYRDQTNWDLKYAYKSSGIWHIETVDSEIGEITSSSLVLDSSNNPHISYLDYMPNYDLKYAYKSGGTWSTEVVDSTGNVGFESSIALTSSDNPCIAYSNNTDYDLKYTCKVLGIWALEIVDSVGIVGSFPSLAFDSSNRPHISYFDTTNTKLKYAYEHPINGWFTETVSNEGDVGRYSSLALDSSNMPHISYTNLTIRDLEYAYKSGDTWYTQTVDSVGNPGSSSLALDSSNNPHISYRDYANKTFMYAYNSSDTWHIEVVENDDLVYSTGNTSLALDFSDTPHFSHHDEANGDLRYATIIDDTTIPTFSSLNIVNNAIGIARDFNISFHLEDPGSDVSDIDIDTLDVTINNDQAITDGTCQSGYDCSIEQTTSYDITINPDNDFNFLQEVEVEVSVDDNVGNNLSSSWSFTTLNPDGDSSPSGGVYDTRTDSTGNYVFADLNPKILTISGPGEETRLWAYDRHGNETDVKIETGLFPPSYTDGAGIVSIDHNHNLVRDQFLFFARGNLGSPQARIMGLRSDGTTVLKGQAYVFQAPGDESGTSSIKSGLSMVSGDFDNDGYEDDAAACLVGDYEPHVKILKDVTGNDDWELLNQFTIPDLGPVGCNLSTFQYDDGIKELVITPHHGPSEPNVYIYTVGGTLKKQFTAYGPGVTNGLTPSGIENRIYVTPNNGTSHVQAFDRAGEAKNFWWAYDQQDTNGNYVVKGDFKNVSGDIDLDGKDEILISPIGANGSQILAFESTGKWRTWPNFFAFNDETLRNGVGMAVIENWHGVN